MRAVEWVCRRVWPRRGRHAAADIPTLTPVSAPRVIAEDDPTVSFRLTPYPSQETR